jgi:hypothetical protein
MWLLETRDAVIVVRGHCGIHIHDKERILKICVDIRVLIPERTCPATTPISAFSPLDGIISD